MHFKKLNFHIIRENYFIFFPTSFIFFPQKRKIWQFYLLYYLCIAAYAKRDLREFPLISNHKFFNEKFGWKLWEKMKLEKKIMRRKEKTV